MLQLSNHRNYKFRKKAQWHIYGLFGQDKLSEDRLPFNLHKNRDPIFFIPAPFLHSIQCGSTAQPEKLTTQQYLFAGLSTFPASSLLTALIARESCLHWKSHSLPSASGHPWYHSQELSPLLRHLFPIFTLSQSQFPPPGFLFLYPCGTYHEVRKRSLSLWDEVLASFEVLAHLH